ncbi:hypothetical protein BB560_004844 [Smittium megazygosporum]|uniref:Extracellular metalloproteinase n=1 Tax=Smittium megazygosporum TaxID=133381 RepID=A0A2T9Z884_9FUNG|nr:hypothetical protein BB560_004844 [Smittium megazygosporum]
MKISVSGFLLLSATAGFASAVNLNSFPPNYQKATTRQIAPFGPNLSTQTLRVDYTSSPETSKPFSSPHLRTINISEAQRIALSHINKELGLEGSDYVVKNAYQSTHNLVSHIYIRQLVNGLEVVNGDININVDKFGNILSMSSSFYAKQKSPLRSFIPGYWSHQQSILEDWASKNMKGIELSLNLNQNVKQIKMKAKNILYGITGSGFIPVNKAAERLAEYLNTQLDSSAFGSSTIGEFTNENGDTFTVLKGIPKKFAMDGQIVFKPAFIHLDDGSLSPVWDLEVKQEDDWWNAFVSADSGEVLSLINWSADASYRVYPFGVNDPSDGDRALLVDPHNLNASPKGWHLSRGEKDSSTTVGNNVYAQENWEGRNQWRANKRPKSSSLNFDYEIDLNSDPKTYSDAAITNLFYVNNMMHDVFHQYGFDEKSGNFQDNNFANGGKGNDAVIANAQDGSGMNNANFATPPDGSRPRMRMYVWDVTSPKRDGDLDAGIIIHEYSHGISIRLTGGPANSGCLGWGEAGGMGEGWGDFFATLIRLKPHHDRNSDFLMGDYAAGRGIRHYPYSTNMKTNPATYKFLDKGDYWGVHPKGSVWAEMLYEVLWNLIDKHGFTTDLMGRNLQYGNVLTLQLVVDAMKLQPCRPGFTDARDAILLADKTLTGGENQCEIWKAFAKRGLGVGAKLVGETPWGGGIRQESFDTVPECS